jgi:hypothetical protein
MWALCKDDDPKVRKALTYRKDLPMDIKVEMYYDDNQHVANSIKYELQSLSEFVPMSETSYEDQSSEINQMAMFGVEYAEDLGYSEDNPAGSKIHQLAEAFYTEENTFKLQKQFENYLNHYKKVGPELDIPYTISIAEHGLKLLKIMNKQRKEYYEFVMSGMGKQAGLPQKYQNISRTQLAAAGMLDR